MYHFQYLQIRKAKPKETGALLGIHLAVPLSCADGICKKPKEHFTIELKQNIPSQTFYLVDLKTNNEHKIAESPYSYTSQNGDKAIRFLLKFGITGIGETPVTPQKVSQLVKKAIQLQIIGIPKTKTIFH